jgi:long-subunit acyl-CoA synthetase (AMP-forming)
MKPRKYTSLHEFFRAKVSSRKDQHLFYYEEGVRKSLSFHEFYHLVNKKRHSYLAMGIGSVAIIHSSSIQSLISMLGASLAGVRSALISPLFPTIALEKMIKASECESLDFDEEEFEMDEIRSLKKCLCPHVEPLEKGHEGTFIYFTSGTSSFSKPVEISSKAFLGACYNGQCMLRCDKRDTIISLLPIEHVFGLVCSILWPLVYGANIAFGSGLANVHAELLENKPTILPLVPSLTKFLLAHNCINPDCNTILVGAGPLNAAAMAAIEQRGIRLAFGYGLTETASGVAISVGGEDPLAMDPCPEDKFRIEKDGTISIFCPYHMEGYFANPEASKRAFTNDGWLKTNDLAFIDKKSRVHILGRKDDIAILENGTKFDCEEADEGFLNTFPTLDFALALKDGIIAFFYYDPKGSSKEAVNKGIESYNRKVSPIRRIGKISRCLAPLPRTKTGKIRRFQLADIPTTKEKK